jgi:hypothetical protein
VKRGGGDEGMLEAVCAVGCRGIDGFWRDSTGREKMVRLRIGLLNQGGESESECKMSSGI